VINTVRSPQPETARDYSITANGTVVATVTKNHQRLNRLRFDAVETKSIRVALTATNGLDQARIFRDSMLLQLVCPAIDNVPIWCPANVHMGAVRRT
jgi:hypothetical protein